MWIAVTIVLMAGCGRKTVEMQPAVISGNSMGAALAGEHRQADCPRCRYHLVFDAAQRPGSGMVICPMCGDDSIAWSQTEPSGGTRCWMDTERRAPARWDVIGCVAPEGTPGGSGTSDRAREGNSNQQKLLVKRVAGLPGEQVSFRDGDLYVDDRICRKSLYDQQKVWLPVFDMRFVGGPEKLRGRLAVVEEAGRVEGWDFSESLIRFSPGVKPDAAGWSTVEYRHEPGFPRAPRFELPNLVLDEYSYNQGISSAMHPVFDLAIEMTVAADPDAEFGFRFLFPGSRIISADFLVGETGRSVVVRENELVLVERPVAWDGDWVGLTVSVIDAQVCVAVNGTVVFSMPCDPFQPDLEVGELPQRQLLLRARGGGMKIADFRIWRDAYLAWDHDFDAPAEADRKVSIPAGCYFLLGDNLPVSRDSRHWNPGPVPADHVLGQVFREK